MPDRDNQGTYSLAIDFEICRTAIIREHIPLQ